jgi:hypothetical protein
MKTFLTTTAVAMTLATASFAADFQNNTADVVITSGVLDFAVSADSAGITDLEVGATGFKHSLGVFDADIRAEVSYNLPADTIGLRAEYNLQWLAAQRTAVYGTAAVQYTTTDTDLGNGDFYFEPSIGVAHSLNDRVGVFGEVGYTWDISNDWARNGGYVEIGAPIAITDSVSLVPSIVRGFDDGVNQTNVNLSVQLSF